MSDHMVGALMISLSPGLIIMHHHMMLMLALAIVFKAACLCQATALQQPCSNLGLAWIWRIQQGVGYVCGSP